MGDLRRISVVGTSGSGKTSLSRSLAELLGTEHIELDAHWNQAGWTTPSREEFANTVRGFAERECWVIDGKYRSSLPLVWQRATTVVWLDFPLPLIMWRVTKRSVLRSFARTHLWNGNRESFRHFLRPDHPIRWAWSTHDDSSAMLEAMLSEPRFTHLNVVRARSPKEASAWLRTVSG